MQRYSHPAAFIYDLNHKETPAAVLYLFFSARLFMGKEDAPQPRPWSEVYERYAAGMAEKNPLPPGGSAALLRRRERLLRLLKKRAMPGWPERQTFFTRSLPESCKPCLEGRGSNVCVTTRCTRDCFFCFNPQPRADAMSIHGRSVSSNAEAGDLLKSLAVRSVGLSGGEPLLALNRTLSLLQTFRDELGPEARLDLYTNGDLLTPTIARVLKKSGLDGARINLVANGFDLKPVLAAFSAGLSAEIEIPVIPRQARRLKALILELDAMGVSHLILHELFVCGQNSEKMRRLGYSAAPGSEDSRLSWAPVAGSFETALGLLLFAQAHAKKLSVYFCSCGTQNWIAENALEHERSLRHG